MFECHAKSTDLLCLMSLDKTLEPYPEPFRMQPLLCVKVSPDIYREFILKLPEGADVLITGQIEQIRHYAIIGSPLLYNCFLREMAFVIAKEVYYAEKYQKECTRIVPSSPMTRPISVPAIVATVDSHCSEAYALLLEIMNSYNFEFNKGISVKNEQHFKLASYLLHLSALSTVKEFSVSYVD